MARILSPPVVRSICSEACQTLSPHIPYSDEAVQQLVFTVGAEVAGRDVVEQYGGGPAISWFQVEPRTLGDIVVNWFPSHPRERDIINREIPAQRTLADVVKSVPEVAAMVARIVYRRSPLHFAPVDDVQAQAELWKAAYNTPQGLGEVHDAAAKYRAWVAHALGNY